MSHPEFTIIIKMKGDHPSVNELKLIRQLDPKAYTTPATEIKQNFFEVGEHRIQGLIKPYLDEICTELDKNEITYKVV